MNPNYKNFGPRVGFAYQLTDTGKVVLRGGYGIFYDRPNMRLYNSQLFNMPYEMLATALETPTENPFVQVPLPSAFPLTPKAIPALLSHLEDIRPSCRTHRMVRPRPLRITPVPATGIYPDLHDWSIPYVQTFNLGVQWSFANNWMLDVGYVGSEGRKFPRLFSFNQAAYSGLRWISTRRKSGRTFVPRLRQSASPRIGQPADGEQL